MPHEGDMTLDASNSAFVPDLITAFDSSDLSTAIATSTAPHTSLTLYDLPWNGDYTFEITGSQKGEFEIDIICESDSPTAAPTNNPTASPTDSPSPAPSSAPSPSPTSNPTTDPTMNPTAEPTADPTPDPTADPSAKPTGDPTIDPTINPTTSPSAAPTVTPSISPSMSPSDSPSAAPTGDPTVDPTADPTFNPSQRPTTPSPLHYGEMVCGETKTGDYNDEALVRHRFVFHLLSTVSVTFYGAE